MELIRFTADRWPRWLPLFIGPVWDSRTGRIHGFAVNVFLFAVAIIWDRKPVDS